MYKFIAGFCVVACASLVGLPNGNSATGAVTHGPIIQDVTPSSATLWLRTAAPATVAVEYGEPGASLQSTPPVTTNAAADFTAEVVLTGLAPATRYEYQVVVDGDASAARTFTSAPPHGDGGPVDIALFADSFGARPAPSIRSAAAKRPDIALTLGDWDHRNGPSLEARRERFRFLRGAASNLGADVAATIGAGQIPWYATWDDHDFCANNSTGRCASRAAAMQSWNEYHAFSADNGWPDGIWQRFEYGPAEVYMLDMRSNRNPSRCAGCRSILGPVQEAWLFDRLESSTARWKIIVTSVAFNDTIYKDGDAWQGYDADRLRLLDFIHEHGVTNVVFASGDIHSGGAIDDGTNSGRPEISVPLANQGFGGQGNGIWSVGQWRKSKPGFGWLTVSDTELTMKTFAPDGSRRLSYTVASEAAPAE